MVSYVTQAVTWGISRMLGSGEADDSGHQSLEHAHWDAVAQRWITHPGDDQDSIAPAA